MKKVLVDGAVDVWFERTPCIDREQILLQNEAIGHGG
jgi:hypothetical protein